MRINKYPNIRVPTADDCFLLDGQNGTRTVTGKDLAKFVHGGGT